MFSSVTLYLWIFIVSLIGRHDFHSSLSEINYNPKTEALEITIRVFTDDFEKALAEQNGGNKIKLDDSQFTEQQIEKYLKKHFALLSPAKQVKAYQYLGKETELNATWLYVEIADCRAIKGYTLYNVIMLELFDDQTNLVNIISAGQRRSYIFNQKVKIDTYPF